VEEGGFVRADRHTENGRDDEGAGGKRGGGRATGRQDAGGAEGEGWLIFFFFWCRRGMRNPKNTSSPDTPRAGSQPDTNPHDLNRDGFNCVY
jgi:hypothetical protein